MKIFKNIGMYFLLSILITYVFIAANSVYDTLAFKLLALTIAGIVWGLQIIGAFLLLDDKKYIFIEAVAKVCWYGSLALMVSVFINKFFIRDADRALYISGINVLLSVLLMACLFASFLKRSHISNNWLWFWLLSLCIAVPTQAWLVGLL